MNSSDEDIEYIKSIELTQKYSEKNLDYISTTGYGDGKQSSIQQVEMQKIRRKLSKKSVSSPDKCAEDESASLASKSKRRVKAKKIIDEDKVRKRKELAREKLEIALNKKRIKNIQPGECMKFIEIYMDCGIKNFDFYTETVSMLASSSVKCSVNSSDVPNSIVWSKIIEEDSIDDDNKVNTVIRRERDKHVLIIWSWEKIVEHIHDDSFVGTVNSLYDLMPEMELSFILYGMNGYFEYYSSRNKKIVNQMHNNIAQYPKISRIKLEECLIKIQIFVKCNTRLIDTAVDMSLLIYQYTKSIAEIPFKQQTRNRLNDQLNFYASGDNRNTIKVDKDGYGLRKLWLKQLCCFNNSSLPVAEAICSVYPSPQQLIDVYKNCSQEEGENLLKNIPIRRAAGPLTTSRKLGPELSKKIYCMFTTTNGEQLLS